MAESENDCKLLKLLNDEDIMKICKIFSSTVYSVCLLTDWKQLHRFDFFVVNFSHNFQVSYAECFLHDESNYP